MRRVGLTSVAAFTAILATVAGGTSATAADKSFSLQSLNVEATIAPDGSMHVVERVIYQFVGGPFTVGIRSFLPDDRNRISDFTATAQDVLLTTTAPTSSISGEWEWEFDRSATDEDRTFELTYDVPRAVAIGADVGELYWQFLGKDHPGVRAVSVTINLPGSFTAARVDTPPDDAGVVRAWGHGPRAGRVDVGGEQVTLAVDDVPAGRFVEARLAIPAEVFTGDQASGPRLADILAEEGADIDQTLADDVGRGIKLPRKTQGLGRVLTLVSSLAGAVGTFLVGRRYGREPTPDGLIGEYWREPLDDPPAVALATMSNGSIDLGSVLGSTTIDLAQRGFLRIEEHHEEKFGPDTHEFILHRTDADLDRTKDPVRPFERMVIDKLFAGRTTTTSDDITEWATADPPAAKAFADELIAAVKAEFKARGYNEPHNGAGIKAVFAVAGPVALLGLVAMVLGTKLGWLALGAAVAMVVIGAVLVQNRTQTGADEAAKAAGLKKFLEDFSQLSDAPAGHLILWERFLVFAVAFGVAGQLLHGLETRLPGLIADPSFGVWYAGPGGPTRFRPIERFPASFGNATAAAIAPSKSGSGGGFSSSGGGGGSGGGGFGAR